MKRGFNACQTHRSMYPSIFNCFPVIQAVSSKVHHFSTFLHILAYPGYAPGTIAVNVTWLERGLMLVKRIAAYTHLSSTVYELLVENWNWNFFPTPLHLTPPLGVFSLIPGKSLVLRKLESRGSVIGSEDSLTIGWAISTQYQRVTDGRKTDGRTDVQPISITCAVILTHVKNEWSQSLQTWYMEWSWDIVEVIWFWDWQVLQRSRSHGQQVHFSHYKRASSTFAKWHGVSRAWCLCLMIFDWQQQYGVGSNSRSAF